MTDDHALFISFRSAEDRDTALNVISEAQPTLIYESVDDGPYFNLLIRYPEVEVRDIEERALQQNLTALKNRVNELGVAEPLVQRQGRNRIVVELPRDSGYRRGQANHW